MDEACGGERRESINECKIEYLNNSLIIKSEAVLTAENYHKSLTSPTDNVNLYGRKFSRPSLEAVIHEKPHVFLLA